ncbi:MAG TPA: hypothetical protein VGM88_17845 [Kofleriaceae bacterium]
MAVVVVALAGAARADGIVIESYTGSRPADAERRLHPLLEALSGRGYVAGNTLAIRVDTEASRPSHTSQGLPPNIAAEVEHARQLYVDGDFQGAVHVLQPLLETTRANAAEVVLNQQLLDAIQEGLTVLALSQQRTGDTASSEHTFQELARAYPQATVRAAQYGPAASQMFERAKATIATGGKGRLAVRVDGNAYIDERFIGTGPIAADDLPPGEYRVIGQTPTLVSRTHVVHVTAGQTATVVVDAGLDNVLRTGAWVGFEFATAAEREKHEDAYAAQLANALHAQSVVVIGIDSARGKPSVIGGIVNLQTGKALRRASVPLDDATEDKLHALASFLGGEQPAAGIEVLPDDDLERPADDHQPMHDASGGRRWGPWPWVTGGLAVGAIATGAVIYSYNGSCTTMPTDGGTCPNKRNTKGGAFATLGAGAALAAVTVFLIVTDHRVEPMHTAFVAPAPGGGAIAGIAGRF